MNKRLFLSLWLIFVLIISIMPTPDVKLGSMYPDKLVHFISYGITAILILIVPSERESRFSLLLSITLSSLYGLLIETIQSFLPYRSFSLGDLAANTLGAIVSVILWKVFIVNLRIL